MAKPKFNLGDVVRKKSGSEWHGAVVGTYSTALTPEGYAVESSAHPGSVQIYPAGALDLVAGAKEVCRFPDCKCPMDPGPEPDWCARGLPRWRGRFIAQREGVAGTGRKLLDEFLTEAEKAGVTHLGVKGTTK